MKLTSRLKAMVVALGVSVLPASEVNSGTSYSRQEVQPKEQGSSLSYGGRLGIGFNGDLSLGAQLLSSNKAKSVIGKVGLDFILSGADRGAFAASVGVGYLFPRGITSTLEGRYNPKSESPFSLGVGLGYGKVKKDGGDGNGETTEPFECIGGTLVGERECECPKGTIRAFGPSGVECIRPY